jgi:hypothetical protein
MIAKSLVFKKHKHDMNKYLIITCYFMLNLNFLSCQSKKKLEIDWKPSVNAPELYPAFVYNGDFWAGGKFESLPTDGFLNNGWGETGLTMGSGNFVPERLDITWFSVVENKFYKGRFELPKDTMQALFDQGVMASYGTLERYDILNVNMAPGGMVVVWMMASGERKVEIGRYQASETEVDWKEVMPQGEQDRNKYVKESIAEYPNISKNIEENGIQYGLFDSYRIRYPWKPVLILQEGDETEAIRIHFYNGEFDHMWGEGLTKNFFFQKALPKKIYFNWHLENGDLFGANVFFDEKEVFEAFKEMYKKDKEQGTELVFIPDKDYKKLKVYLRSKTEEIWLRKTKTGIYTN